MNNINFESALNVFISGCNELLKKNYDSMPNYPKNCIETLILKRGKKYIKVCRAREGKACSAFCFINQNGDVLLPASWKAPAKHARGNIFDESSGLKYMSWTGPAYLK